MSNRYAFTQTPEYRAKMSAIMKGRPKPPRTKEHAQKLANAKIGKKASEETRRRMSESQKVAQNKPERIEQLRQQMTGSKINIGRSPWNKGKPYPGATGVNNKLWKGSDVGYRALHHWVTRWLGSPNVCQECHESNLEGRRIHWANISQEYKREITDWARLCAKCHRAYDLGKLKLTQNGGYSH